MIFQGLDLTQVVYLSGIPIQQRFIGESLY
jgi:hypothetical protein